MRIERIGKATLYLGDSNEVIEHIEQVQAVVTDPPYGLSFCGHGWDYDVPSIELWQAIADRMAAGAHLLAFGGTRTYHRLVCAMEDAGLEVRDMLAWLYGTGMAKGRNLKPANEPICLARKPFRGSQRAHIEATGLGALRIDENRVPSGSDYHELKVTSGVGTITTSYNFRKESRPFEPASGRWPANVIHDGNDDILGDKARYFYAAKPSRKERQGNPHPTVKPIALMKHLIGLVTPPNGTVLDPFMGSGTTGVSAIKLGHKFIGIERDETYFETAVRRLREAAE